MAMFAATVSTSSGPSKREEPRLPKTGVTANHIVKVFKYMPRTQGHARECLMGIVCADDPCRNARSLCR